MWWNKEGWVSIFMKVVFMRKMLHVMKPKQIILNLYIEETAVSWDTTIQRHYTVCGLLLT